LTCGEWENEDRGSICDRSQGYLGSQVRSSRTSVFARMTSFRMTAVMATFASLPLPIRGVAAYAQSQASNVEAERGRLSCGRVARRPGRAPQGRGPRPFSPHAPCRSPGALTRVAARTLARSPIRDQLHRRLQPFRYLHDCSGCFRLERLAGGACTHWKAPPVTAHYFQR
jgi:hypothetical protein